MFKVIYHYSACVSVHVGDLRILCDPWFTDGIYDGAWFQFPKLDNPISKIGRCDYIYISHIHPDHYDSTFLKKYLIEYPATKIIIADFKHNFLHKKMVRDGLVPIISKDEISHGNVCFKIFPNESSSFDIDSAMVVKSGGLSFVNMNDNLFNESQLTQIKEYVDGKITFAALTYTGAGPYPQTYYPANSEIIKLKGQEKKEAFFERYKRLRDSLSPLKTLPFAGKYHLGGKLVELNEFRGVSDPIEVKNICEKSVVLDDTGIEYFDLETMKASKERENFYDPDKLKNFYSSISNTKMDYEIEFANLPFEKIDFKKLLTLSYRNALARSSVSFEYLMVIKIQNLNCIISLNKNFPKIEWSLDAASTSIPRSEIEIDYRYLFGLITGIYHWNNAEIGSQYRVTRIPDIFNRDVQAFLNFFHI